MFTLSFHAIMNVEFPKWSCGSLIWLLYEWRSCLDKAWFWFVLTPIFFMVWLKKSCWIFELSTFYLTWLDSTFDYGWFILVFSSNQFVSTISFWTDSIQYSIWSTRFELKSKSTYFNIRYIKYFIWQTCFNL